MLVKFLCVTSESDGYTSYPADAPANLTHRRKSVIIASCTVSYEVRISQKSYEGLKELLYWQYLLAIQSSLSEIPAHYSDRSDELPHSPWRNASNIHHLPYNTWKLASSTMKNQMNCTST